MFCNFLSYYKIDICYHYHGIRIIDISHNTIGFVIVMAEFIKFYIKFFVFIFNFQVYIHPFADGNGRVSRLLMNLLLESFDYPAAIVSVYKRLEYIKSLNAAHRGDVRSFVRFVLSQLDASIEVWNLLNYLK